MAYIGKITPCVTSLTQEVTLAAAAFNVDFSLMKVEVPQEYERVRKALTPHRRSEAESGESHAIARRLGALFESRVPPIPNLIRTYGIRASEISSTVSGSNQFLPDLGCFKDQGGLDLTSIWATATFGRGALAVHLLACLLARIWTAPEAISLWIEIIERRKQEIAQNFEGASALDVPSLNASQQFFARQQLAAWDSSARSWLQSADAARQLQHTQLTLVMNNLRMPVNSNSDPYHSVLKVWTSAMIAMDRLVQGVPQRVQDGAILLAISSWHLYPDMEVLVGECKTVLQNDSLMKGAIVTVSAHGIGDKEGVF